MARTRTLEDLFDSQGLAEYLQISPRTIQKMRMDGSGPRFARINDRGDVRYRLVDVAEWLARRAAESQPDRVSVA